MKELVRIMNSLRKDGDAMEGIIVGDNLFWMRSLIGAMKGKCWAHGPTYRRGKEKRKQTG